MPSITDTPEGRAMLRRVEEQIKFLQRKPTIMRRSTVDRVRREQVEREGKKKK